MERIKAKLMDEAALRRAVTRMAHEIVESNHGVENLCLVGVRRKGEPLAEMLRGHIAQIEGVEVPCGHLDIRLYRDDLIPASDMPEMERVELPFSIE